LMAAAAAVALLSGSRDARADFAYAFATQTISGLSITPAITVTSPAVTTFTQDGSTLNGSGLANSNPLDAVQAYQGGLPAAPQNFFARYAPGSPPVSPVGNFTRGDALISSIAGPTNSSSVVAESYLNTVTPATETGSAGLGANFSFTVPTATALTIAYNYASRIFVFQTGSGTATASYNFGVTIKDAAGTVVFNSATAETNLPLSAPPPGGEIIRAGAQAVVTPILAVGTTYSISFSSTAQSSVAVVPEPSSVALFGIGGAAVLAMGLRRKAKA